MATKPRRKEDKVRLVIDYYYFVYAAHFSTSLQLITYLPGALSLADIRLCHETVLSDLQL